MAVLHLLELLLLIAAILVLLQAATVTLSVSGSDIVNQCNSGVVCV
jgi:hypothetical protein